MTAERWEIIDEEFISYTGGTAQLISNGECEIHLWERPKDAQLFCDKLNAINEENEQLKSTIAQLIEQNSKNNKLLLSDIRILQKALWCSGCENDYDRLRELRREFIR